ncbi:MAG: DUF2029 domain-containing protein, partial [Promethearchaeota archaeon]
ELWKEYRIFKYALILHLGYFIASLILILTVFREQNDFLIFYNAGGIFLHDIDNLYSQEHYIWDFRYFPLSAAMFIPFYLLGYDLGVILYQLINLILNFLICVLLYKICRIIKGENHEQDDKRVILFLGLYLMAVPHMLNYALGQINQFITFFMLLSLFIFLTRKGVIWEFIGGFILGISIIIKPTTLFLIPFLLVIHLNFKPRTLKIDFKTSFSRIFGVISPVLFNFIWFFLYPKMFQGFITTNFTGSNPLTINFSFSLTKLILNYCYLFNIPFNQLYVLIALIGLFAGSGFFFYLIMRQDQNKILYGYTLGILIMLITYYDSWNHHLLNLLPLMILIMFNLPRNSELTVPYFKRSFFYFSFFDIGYMGVWFLLYPYFPFNFMATIFLTISFIGVCKYAYKNRGHTQEEEKIRNED